MSVPQEDLTGMWVDTKGKPRQVLDRARYPYDNVWNTRFPDGHYQLTSEEFIRLNWTRA